MVAPVLKPIWDQSFDRVATLARLYEFSKRQGRGRRSFHPFALGHIFSSTLIEEITNVTDKEATWGQALDESRGLSPEIDVIIYHGKPLVNWPRAGYTLVKPGQVLATVSCKVEIIPDTPRSREFNEEVRTLKQYLPRKTKNFIFGQYVYRGRDIWEKQKRHLIAQGWDGVYVLHDGTQGDMERREDWYGFLGQVSGL